MEQLLADTTVRIQHVQQQGLVQLERSHSEIQAADLQVSLAQQLDQISSNCETLETMVLREPVAKRRHSKYRVDQLTYDCNHLKAALQALEQKLAVRWRQQKEREELLTRRFTANDSTSVFVGDQELEANDRLKGTTRHVDQLLDHGNAVLDNLRSQHGNLKGVKRKILDVSNQLGLSSTVMRMIERRTAQDKVILFTGMVVTTIIMYILYRWIKG